MFILKYVVGKLMNSPTFSFLSWHLSDRNLMLELVLISAYFLLLFLDLEEFNWSDGINLNFRWNFGLPYRFWWRKNCSWQDKFSMLLYVLLLPKFSLYLESWLAFLGFGRKRELFLTGQIRHVNISGHYHYLFCCGRVRICTL